LLRTHVEAPSRTIISVPHVGKAGLNSIAFSAAEAAEISSASRLQRIEMWVDMIKVELGANAA